MKQDKQMDAQPTREAEGKMRWKKFCALIQGEYQPEFKRALAMALRRERRAQKPQADPEIAAAVRRALAGAQEKVWRMQEEQARVRYPALSLAQEMENPDFMRLLTDKEHPMSVQRAYECIHLDEIRAETARLAAVQTAQRLAERARRPREGGAAPQAGLHAHWGASDPKSRAAIARRAMRGEQIRL